MTSKPYAVAVPVATVWTAPDAARDVDRPAIRSEPDAAGWADSLDRENRLGLHGRTLTQALCGEPVLVESILAGWAQVVLPWQPSATHPEGYAGWLPFGQLGDPLPVDDHVAVVLSTTAQAQTQTGEVTLSYGTVLPLLDARRHQVEVATPGGPARLDTADVLIRAAGERSSSAPGRTLADEARRFIGLRYLWGGLSAWGLDCSGLVHLVARTAGITLPRDAADQHAMLPAVELDAAESGDLYFFATAGSSVTHVGFATSNPPHRPRTMLHAPEGDERVEDARLAPQRLDTLVGAGRITA